MTPFAWIGLAAAGTWIYKKKPQWIPAPLRPKSAAKIAALGKVSATSTPTPHPQAGMDEGMTSAQVAAANGLLASGTDSGAMYQMASDLSAQGFVKTSEALIRKADAIDVAKKHGAEDDELYAQMMAAASAGQAAGGVSAPEIAFPGAASSGSQAGKAIR